MKFLHISDTHLGYRQYGLLEREQDFLDVFNEAIDIAIENKVDFIIHTGDFFHSSRPSNKTIIDSLSLLNRLKEANIPIFCIPGNHDRGNSVRDISPLDILKNFGLNLIQGEVKEFNGIDIVGIKYIPKVGIRKLGKFRDILEKFLEKSKNKYKILMLHQEFYPYFPNSNLLINEEIPLEFNYTGIGHYHIATEPIRRENNSFVVHIGSTEFTAYNKDEEKIKKKVALVSVSNDFTNIEFIELKNTRKFIYETLDDDSIEEKLDKLILKVRDILENNSKKPVVILKGNFKKLGQFDVLKILNEKGINQENDLILYVKHNFNFLKENYIDNSDIKHKDDNDIVKEILEKELKDDQILKDKLLEILNTFRSFEDLDTLKEHIKENPNIFEDLLN